MKHLRAPLVLIVVLALSAVAGGTPAQYHGLVSDGWPQSGYSLSDVVITLSLPRYSFEHHSMEIVLEGSGVGRWECVTRPTLVRAEGEFSVSRSDFVALHSEFYRRGFFDLNDSLTSLSATVDGSDTVSVWLVEIDDTPEMLCFAVSGSTRCVRWIQRRGCPEVFMHLRDGVLEVAAGSLPQR